jgi:RNA recognition motif-containing protein
MIIILLLVIAVCIVEEHSFRANHGVINVSSSLASEQNSSLKTSDLIYKFNFFFLVAFQIETAAEANRILLASEPGKKTTVKKKKTVERPKSARPTRGSQDKHYHLNLAELPFLQSKVGNV